MRNVTRQCVWLIAQNQRDESGVGQNLDAAACFFLSILPQEGAAPLLVALISIVVALSLLVNGFALFRIEGSRELSWQPRFNLLKNLILSDLIQTAALGPPLIYSLLHRRTMVFNLWCHMQYFWGATTICCSLFTITGMAVERYLYVCHAMRYLSIVTMLRLRMALSMIWVVSIGVGVTSVAVLHLGKERESLNGITSGLVCEPDTIERQMGFPRASAIFRKVMACILLLTCSLAHGFSYLRMYQDARNALVPFHAVNTRARKTVLFYSCMLVLQLLPILLKATSDALWELKGNGAMVSNDTQLPSLPAVVLHMSLVVMTLVPPCINPLVYSLRNKEVRQVLAGPVGCWRRSTDPTDVEDRGGRAWESSCMHERQEQIAASPVVDHLVRNVVDGYHQVGRVQGAREEPEAAIALGTLHIPHESC